MKLINKDQVSHIVVFKETEGIKTWHGRFVKRVWMPTEYFKFLWFIKTPFVKYEEGFYRDCKRESIVNDTPFNIETSKNNFLRDNSVWTKPFIQIFSAGKEIHTEYFDTYEELEQHIKDNYNNCTIRYE